MKSENSFEANLVTTHKCWVPTNHLIVYRLHDFDDNNNIIIIVGLTAHKL